MRRSTVFVVAAVAAFAASCSKDTGRDSAAPAAQSAASPAADEQRVAKIPILPGYKYYVGGPTMKRDPYGRYRLSAFNGEVAQPPSRGMIFGARREGDQLEYRVWGNAILLGVHRGVMRDGVFWQDYAEGYRDGRLVAREHDVHDDAVRRSKVTTEDLDPQTGELIRTKEASISYLPPAIKSDDEDADEEEMVPIVPLPAAPAAAAAAAPPAPPPAAPADATAK